MQDDNNSKLGGINFTKYFEARRQEQKQTVEKIRTTEAKALVAVDGRISSKSDRKGNVQLNTRVPLDVKNQVLEERARRKAAGSPNADVGDIVAEALRAFLSAPRV